MTKYEPKVIAWYKIHQNSQPTPIYGRLGYGKNKKSFFIYETRGNLFKFLEDEEIIEIDKLVTFGRGHNSATKKNTTKLHIEQYECDTKQILDMILKGRGTQLYSLDAISRKEIVKKLTKEAVVRRMTK